MVRFGSGGLAGWRVCKLGSAAAKSRLKVARALGKLSSLLPRLQVPHPCSTLAPVPASSYSGGRPGWSLSLQHDSITTTRLTSGPSYATDQPPSLWRAAVLF